MGGIWEAIHYYMGMGFAPDQAAQMAGIPPSAMARMQGADGGYQAPSLLDDTDPEKRAQTGAQFGMNLMNSAKAKPLKVPEATAYRPQGFSPITIKGLL